MDAPFFFHALKVNEEVCIGCSHCMNACPTEAIRIWSGKAVIDENQCIDCGECHRVCPVNAIYVDQDEFDTIFNYKYRVALFPSVFIGQFPGEIKAGQVYKTLLEIGFTHVYEVERAVEILNESILEYQGDTSKEHPIISSFCPAIIRLVQVKFPSLVDNILKLGTPSDIAAQFYKKKLIDKGIAKEDIGIFYITPCAAKIAAIKSPVGEEKSVVSGAINLNNLYNRVYRKIKEGNPDNTIEAEPTELYDFEILWTLTKGEASRVNGRALAIDGIHNAMEFLEKVENEEVSGIDFLECRACHEGCAGGILNPQNRFLIVERMQDRVDRNRAKGGEITPSGINNYKEYLKRKMPLGEVVPRSMMMLDTNMAEAMKKMKQAKKIETQLPGIDCGACGAPTCRALSEDIVKGNASLSHCVFVQKVLMKNGEINMDTAFAIIDKIWGEQRVVRGSLKKNNEI
ncbi:MAG: 4Fe-4S binding protein [Salinivirgaceae bacterium]|nr:4Fe-4S binding protein [Salinivirgaceae bacterium]